MSRRCVCINLDTSVQRWKQVKAQLTPQILEVLGQVERVSAITPETAPPKPEGINLIPGSWACYQSHLSEIKRAIDDGIDELTILEDDVIFDTSFVSGYRALLAAVPKGWDVLYLGGKHKAEPFEVTEQYVRCRDTVHHHAWMLQGDGLRKVYEHLANYDELAKLATRAHNKDQWCAEGIALGRFVAYAPRRRWLAHQRYGKSDRLGKKFYRPVAGNARTHPAVFWPRS
jgi:GR25 family glycosyltransferase involved in LPS biosynthesis